MNSSEPIDALAAVFARLPGVGRRSAQRMALKVARDAEKMVGDFVSALQGVRDHVRICSLCGNLTLRDQDPCLLCTDKRRDPQLLCVVEDPGDMMLLEQAGTFRGRYHALMGKISPRKGEGIHNPRLEALLKRVEKEDIREVILALNTDVESDATVSYLRERLASKKVRVSRLAFGIPAGSGIAYSDAVTLSRAIECRQEM